MFPKSRARTVFFGLVVLVAAASPGLAQTAGEGSGSEAVGSGAMIKSPEHAEKGGDAADQRPQGQSSDRSNQKSNSKIDEEINAGSASPSTAPK